MNLDPSCQNIVPLPERFPFSKPPTYLVPSGQIKVFISASATASAFEARANPLFKKDISKKEKNEIVIVVFMFFLLVPLVQKRELSLDLSLAVYEGIYLEPKTILFENLCKQLITRYF